MRIAVALVALTLAVPALHAQDPYTHIVSVVELGNGSVVVLDDREHEVWLLQPDLVHRERLVTSGAGPGETRIPIWLVPGPGGSVMLWDVAQIRLTRCTPGKKPQCVTVTMPEGQMGSLQLLGVDREGRSYHAIYPRPGLSSIPDSSMVMRYDSKSGAFDEVARIEWSPSFMVEKVLKSEGSIRTNRWNMPVPLVSGDQLAILSSGEVIALPATGTELIRFPAGQPIRERLAPGRPEQPVLPAERDSLMHLADSLQWGETAKESMPVSKRAFRPHTLKLSPRGNLWVSYYEAEKSTRLRFDAYAVSGKRIGEIDLALNCRLVGVGRKFYYTACRDEDDLETLAAVPVPAWEATGR